MRKGFTLVECMIAGAILTLVVTAFMRALSVISRVENENAQYMVADAIVWDAIASHFNLDYNDLKAEYWSGGRWQVKQFDVTNRQHQATLSVTFDGTRISAWIEWNRGMMLSNSVVRSEYARKREDDAL